MVLISPCAGCDTPTLARILASLEAVFGIVTIIKSAWWYFLFRIPVHKRSKKQRRNLQTDENQELGETSAINDVSSEEVQGRGKEDENDQDHDHDHDEEDDTDSNFSYVYESNTNNILWTMTGMVMGSLNIILGLFLLLGLATVNYGFLMGWCLSFPLVYLLDSVLFTFLLKYCTTKERFDRCRKHFISSTILGFVFNSYVLWVGISVVYWCNCRDDPYRCRFQRDYCHSFLNFSRGDGHPNFYDIGNDFYGEMEIMSF